MRRLPSLACLLVVLSLAPASRAAAEETIRFARTPDVSPDGSLVAFSYLGDIWVVGAAGGEARPITMHSAHDIDPVFSPDGKWLAFSSNRHGQYDVFVVPVKGGKPRRLTYHSADDHVCGWSPDGQHILFTSTRAIDYPFDEQLYRVPATGGRVQRVTAAGGRQGAWSPNGREIAYVRGPGAPFRKGYKGSANDDIWVCDVDGKNNRQLTKFNGQDDYPSWSPDGRTIYYVSDDFGATANVVCQDLGNEPGQPLTLKGKPRQVTFHKDEAVRQARLSRDGNWLVYECGADLWLAPAKGGAPRKLNIHVHADEKSNSEREVTFTSGASELAVSPDEKSIALVIHGEIFLLPRGGGKAKRLTSNPSNNHGIAWSPDSKRLVFLSDRNGQEDVYELASDDPKSPGLAGAKKVQIKQLTNSPQAEAGVNFSPDGKRISFLREGKLVTMNPDGSDPKLVVDQPAVIDYEWSPDSKWICYSRMDGSYASELYIVPAGGATAADPARNVTQYATYNASITWSKAGKIAFLSERGISPEKNLYVLSLQRPALPGTTPAGIDWDDIHLRTARLSSLPASRAVIAPNGTKVAFRAASGGEEDLWVAATDGSSLRRLTKGNLRPTQIQWSSLLPNLIYFLDGSGSVQMAFATEGAKTDNLKVPFTARLTVKQEEVFKEIFEQSWRFLDENFYDPKFHGVDWKAVRERYRPLLAHVAMREDLNALIDMMMGELNASHTGLQAPPSAARLPDALTAELGLLFDDGFPGPGLKISAVIARGPADKHGLKLKAGDVVTKVDGTPLTAGTNLAKLLNGRAGDTVSLEVTGDPAQPGDPRQVDVQAVGRTAVTPLMYQRWVKHNAQAVAKLSKGRLGYVHIPRMDEAGLDFFLRSLYSDNFDKEGLVLDVRFNPGGHTHDAILTYLSGKVHTLYHPRHGPMGTVFKHTDRKWTKPLTLLINNRSFSSAEVFANGFHALGLGKLVGDPTGGHVIGTGAVKLIDGSLLRLPRIGVFTAKGVNMDKQGVDPDVVVSTEPDQLAQGNDAQLQRAVEALLADLARAKQPPTGAAQK